MPTPLARDADRLLASARDLFQQGQVQESLGLLLCLPPAARSHEDVLLLTAVCHSRLRQVEPAVAAFEVLLHQNPDCYEALTWMAVLRKNREHIGEAIDYAQRAIRLKPLDSSGYGSLGACFLYAKDAAGAIEAFQRAVEWGPDVAENQHNLALAYLMAHRHGDAIPHLRRAISLAPKNSESYLSLAGAYGLFGMAGDMIDCLAEGLKNLPNSAPLHTAAAGAFSMIGNDAAAERHHRRAMELAPNAQSGYATWLLNQGRFEEANRIFDSMIAEGTDPALAYYGKMQTLRVAAGDRMVADMEALLAHPGLNRGSQMHLHYALGRAHEQLRKYESAIRHFDAANEIAYSIHRAGHPYDVAQTQEEHRRVQALYVHLRGTSPSPWGEGSAPIFIVGMIRSGTTLLDQIVSSHPDVASDGELRFWIEETLRLAARNPLPSREDVQEVGARYMRYLNLITDDAKRATDKMPLNFAYIGVMLAAIPNAKFLHIRRNPIDTCLSIYTTYFGAGTLFGYRRANIVAYYREYLEAMDYWRANLPPGAMLELDYEELVANSEPVIREVIEFCGLPWNDACLHHDQNQAAINTPSRWQARQPVYKSSTERWRRYEPWLGEFAELAP